MLGFTFRLGPLAVAIAVERLAVAREQIRREEVEREAHAVADDVADRLRRGSPAGDRVDPVW